MPSNHSRTCFIAGLFSPKLVPTAPPENLTVVVLDSRSLRLSWTPLPADHQNGEVLGYSITLVAVETGTASQHNSSSTSLTISELHPYYTYQCRVAAFNSAGIGPFTAVVEKMTDQDGMYVSSSHEYRYEIALPCNVDIRGKILC